ncbi:MAG: DNA repair protein RecO [Tannerella sp.]|jgi:DNA repair protein RecO (recombination protein O)|nr:DNA repair protein RecO [Tannerella sp.]
MLSKTRGIVLHSMHYSDKYDIVHIYTEAFGRTPYMIARQRGRKRGVSHALFMPLSIVEMEVEHLNTRDIQRVREARICFPLSSVPAHPVKNCIALFLSEVLYRAIRSQAPDGQLFGYLNDSVQWLEMADGGVANFHLVFLMQLVRYLGVYPNISSFSPDGYFDMLNGIFTTIPPEHGHYLDREESVIFSRLLRMNYANMGLYGFSREERQRIIGRILEYYRLHMPDFPEIRSVAVMQSLFE